MSIKTDVIKSRRWVDQQVVVDDGIIASGNSGDLDAFVGKIVEEVEAGMH